MGFLDLESYEPLPPLELQQPPIKKSSTAAFILGMIFPGLGHLYVGLRRNAAWIAGFYVLFTVFFFTVFFFTGLFQGHPMAFGLGIMGMPALYIFGFYDAYASAREWNAGLMSVMIGSNPRVACLLNFLTKGFGYFYLGERGKGLTLFFTLTVLQAVAGAHMKTAGLWLTIGFFVVQIGLALDGYRVGRAQLLQACPELQDDPASKANTGGLPGVVPMIFAGITVVGVLSVYALIALMGRNSRPSEPRNATIEQGPDGSTYIDRTDGFSVTVPEHWTASDGGRGAVATFLQSKDAECSAQVLIEPTWISSEQYLVQVQNLITRRNKVKISDSNASQTVLGGQPASVLTLNVQRQQDQDSKLAYLAVKQRFRMITLFEVNPQNCQEDMRSIESSFSFMK